MPHLELFLVAEDVAIDQQTNRISVFNVLDTIDIPRAPVTIPKCCALAIWSKDDGDDDRDFQSTVTITLADGRTHRQETNFRMTTPRHRIVNRIVGLPVLAAGEIRFELLLNGAHVAWHELRVELLPADAAPAVRH